MDLGDVFEVEVLEPGEEIVVCLKVCIAFLSFGSAYSDEGCIHFSLAMSPDELEDVCLCVSGFIHVNHTVCIERNRFQLHAPNDFLTFTTLPDST